MLLLRNAGVSFTVVVITSLKICYTRVIQVPMSAVDEDVLNERPLRLKNSRSGHLSTVTARLNEIDTLLSNEENIDLVKEKLTDFTAAFEAFKEAHILYLSYVQDETCIARCQESFDREVVRRDDFSRRVQEWIVRTEEAVRLNSQVSPDDSASNGGFRFASKSSRRPGRSSCSRGSRESSCSSLSVVRAKEAARTAELKAEAAVFKKRQFLEEQRFRLKQEEKLLSLETEIAKSQAREQALASVVDPNPRVVLPSPGFMEPDPHIAAADDGSLSGLISPVRCLRLVRELFMRCWSYTNTKTHYSDNRTRSWRCLRRNKRKVHFPIPKFLFLTAVPWSTVPLSEPLRT